MRNIFILIFLIISLPIVVYTQVPQGVVYPDNYGQSTSLIDCMGQAQDAGTFQLGDYQFTSLSNHISKERIFLCAQDRVPLVHNGDMILDGDPDPSTEPGVGYGFYNCAPTINGNSLDDIAADNCHVTSPPPPSGEFYVIVDGGNLNGNLILNNDGSLNENFNNGDPGTWWFAPITFDKLETQGGAYMAAYEQGSGNEGPCVNVRIDEAIEVTYLNPFEITDIDISADGDEVCGGSFVISGGLPEYDNNASYSITMTATSNKNNKATLLGSNYKHLDRVEFTVPINGEYTVVIEDGKNCVQSFTIDVTCDALEISVPHLEQMLGDEFCIPVSVNNFTELISLSFSFQFDPSIIEYTGYTGFDIPKDDGTSGIGDSQKQMGRVSLTWVAKFGAAGPTPLTLPDGTTIIEFCFRVSNQAQVGDVSPTDFTGTPTLIEAITEVIDEEGNPRYQEVGIDFTSGSVTIVNESGLLFTQVSCGSEPNEFAGSFTITAYGGTAPYDVAWNADWDPNINGAGTITAEEGTYTANDLDYGVYNVTITDALGETFSKKVTINDDKPHPGFDLIPTNPTCYDRTNGRLRLENIVAAEPYTIEWSTGQFNEQDLRNLPAGYYSVTLTDYYGCTVEETVAIKYNKIRLEADVTNVSCQGSENGALSLTAFGGEPINGDEYKFTLEDGSSQTGNPVTFNNLSYGWHYVTITDNNSNCENIDSVFIGGETTLIFEEINITQPLCYGEEGSISFTPGTEGSAGATPYRILIVGINNSDPYQGNDMGDGPFLFENVPGDEYLVKLSDANGCEFDTLITLTQPTPITIDPEVIDNSCDAGWDGAIRLNAEGGTGTLSYIWDGGNYTPPTSENISSLPAGDYSVTITDENGCELIESFQVEEPEKPIIENIIRTPISCAGECDGELRMEVTSSTPITDYYWINEQGDTLTGISITGLCAGSYAAYAVDETGCVAFAPANVYEVKPLDTTSTTIVEPICGNQNTGSIKVLVDGGQSPYHYEWSVPGARDSSFIGNLSGGNYSVTITDSRGCGPLELNFTLDSPPAIEVEFTDLKGISCYSDCDGSIIANPSGGISNGPFTYLWADGSTGQSNNNLCGGENYVIISDPICTDTFHFEIPSPDPISLNLLDSIAPTCYGESDGRLEVRGKGGAGNYIYAWEDGSITPYLENLQAGDYQLTITDTYNCTLDTTLTLGQPDSLIVEVANFNHITCPGADDGFIALQVEGGNGGYTFDWSGGVSNSANAGNLSPGQYSVTVTDSEGCFDTTSVFLNSPPLLSFNVDEILDPTCHGGETSVSITNASGGNGGPFIASIEGHEFSVPGSINMPAGTYQVTVEDIEGCTADTTIVITEPDAIIIDMPDNIVTELGENTSINPQILNATGNIVSYSWSPGEFVDCDTCKNVELLISESNQLTLTVIDINGCTAQKTVNITVKKSRNVYFPNAFTPNGDGVNDVFKIYVGPSVEKVEDFQIFNRWGSVIWQRSDIPIINNASATGWDGSANGTMLNPGVYIFKAKILFKDGVTRMFSGDITILDRISYD